jgi:hypothetical protein
MVTKSERWARNSAAFREIIGDPFNRTEGESDPIQGQYAEFRSNSTVKVQDMEAMSKGGSANAARPNALDFFCDVEAAVKDGLAKFAPTWREPDQVEFVFVTTYITEDSKYYSFNQSERSKIEQIIGNIFLARSISPTGKYFTAIRK